MLCPFSLIIFLLQVSLLLFFFLPVPFPFSHSTHSVSFSCLAIIDNFSKKIQNYSSPCPRSWSKMGPSQFYPLPSLSDSIAPGWCNCSPQLRGLNRRTHLTNAIILLSRSFAWTSPRGHLDMKPLRFGVSQNTGLLAFSFMPAPETFWSPLFQGLVLMWSGRRLV